MIKKIILPIAVIALLSSCGGDAEPKDLTTEIINNPITASDKAIDEDQLPFFEFVEVIKDFGTITQGESVSMTFRFKNVGQSNLIISSAQGSCGCTVPEWPKNPIGKGEEAAIKVTFNSAGKLGKQNKTVTLVTNAMPNTKVITINGNVIVPQKK